MLGPIAAAYEHAMSDGEGRNTWRTDRYSPCPRTEAAGYLRFLASIGYPLSGIEQAVADLTPYTGDAPAGDADHLADRTSPDQRDQTTDQKDQATDRTSPVQGRTSRMDRTRETATSLLISADPGEEPADGQAAA